MGHHRGVQATVLEIRAVGSTSISYSSSSAKSAECIYFPQTELSPCSLVLVVDSSTCPNQDLESLVEERSCTKARSSLGGATCSERQLCLSQGQVPVSYMKQPIFLQ